MPPSGDVPSAVPLGYLLVAIVGLCGVVGVLFWQLMRSTKETLDLAREVYPLATKLVDVVGDLQKLVDRLEHLREGHHD